MGQKEKSKKSKTHKAEDLQQLNSTVQPAAYQPPSNASGSSYDQQYGYPPLLQSQAQSQNQWPSVQNSVPQPQGWHGGQQYGQSSSNMQQQTTTTTHVTRHVQHLAGRRQAWGHQEQQQQQAFQPAPPPPIQQPQQPPPPAQQHNTIDYESLRVAMPTPQIPTPAPARRDRYPLQQSESQPSPAPRQGILDLDSLRIDTPASRPSRSARHNHQQTTRTTTTTTESYEGQHDGGETRRQAEAEGPAAVEQYERRVMQLLAYSENCPAGLNWFNMRGGYICLGGNHWISHRAIDDYFGGKDPTPRMEFLNFLGFDGYNPPATVHPPTELGPAGIQAHGAHWLFMQRLAACGGYALIVRSSSRRRGRDAEGLGEKPCECVRALRMRVYETPEDNPQDMSRIRNPTYVSSGHFRVGVP
ncbi:hypothetical protein KC332_g8575 [Hortaea werneckii]|nr:hypothetical protein KC358_g8421 [Hortaea werneckii]KAI6829430.1 hypothetical protein KC350_g7849 [Hortaea werneckii]KAI6926000.1 hypothetical protein KC348_g8821 [Hortaea werneckii]KAI6933490.1 hypothetical protein KC341_g8282 [Hortaea werneckii]KAI6968053.1 hypothetical protein KC321_g8683 [Hortaea werneckii]